MAIDINPNPIRSGNTGRADDRRRQQTGDYGEVIVPKRAHVNMFPAPESLHTLIRSAVAALRQGITWDRGTILNLLV